MGIRDPESTKPLPSSPAHGEPYTALYVEDDAANLMLVGDILEHRRDIQLVTAIEGHWGFALACTLIPDVILLDMCLPDIGALELLNMLKHDERTVRIPVIAVSSVVLQGDIDKGLRAGFFTYLAKPFKIAELLESIDRALNLPDDRSFSEKLFPPLLVERRAR